MFSGKSERLLARAHDAGLAGRRFMAFKHASDDRYADGQIVTHHGHRLEAVAVSDPRSILDLAAGADLVLIDEVQFFPGDIVAVCRELADRGVGVVAAGLDLDSWGLPFGAMPMLARIADVVTPTHGQCSECGKPATHTQRLAPIESETMIGGPEAYAPRCAACFAAPPAELRR